jgi:hypothetical protein
LYAFEGSTEQRSVSGTTLVDVDLLEGCSFSNQKCSAVDAKVAVLRGQITLGSKGGISLYKDTATTQAFTGPLSSAVISLSTVLYVARSNDPEAVLSFNTQTLLPDSTLPRETISFDVSDQSFTGASVGASGKPRTGVAQVFTLVLNLTVVAMNNAPVITAPLQLDAREDVRLVLGGLTVSDVDADSTVVSSLAQYLWMNATENQDFLNKVQVTLSVLHGRLFFPVLKGMLVVSASEQEYYVFKSRYSFHDLCRMKAIYNNPSTITSYRANCIKAIDKSVCPTGLEGTCLCMIADSCSDTGTGTTTLFLNSSSKTYKAYLAALQDSLTITDRTCGGVPFYPTYTFTTGHLCTSNADCESLTSCANSPEGCLCCANLNVTCRTNSDCSTVQPGSLCGCTWNGPASLRTSNAGQCGPWFKGPLLVSTILPKSASTLGDLVSSCKATGTYQGASCNKNFFSQSERPLDCPTCQGLPCTYLGAGYRKCIPPVILSQGTGISVVTDPLSETGAVKLVFYGQLRLVNRVLAAVAYQTNLNYNRLYRLPQCYPPPLQLTKECQSANSNFLPTVDDNELLSISVDDLGNSGGIARDTKITLGAMKINVEAVNDRPKITAPRSILAVEDLPFSFLNFKLLPLAGLSLPHPDFYENFLVGQCKFDKKAPNKIYDITQGAACLCYRECNQPLNQFNDFSCSCVSDDCEVLCSRQTQELAAEQVTKNIAKTPRMIGDGISISDPDYLDYGFLDMAFEVNISCLHGKIMLNEAFLQQRDLLSTRIKVLSYDGYGTESPQPSTTGENIGVGLYYSPLDKSAEDCDFCSSGWLWKDGIVQCCEKTSSASNSESYCRTCPKWGVGNRFVSLSGTLADLNLALSNVTYIGDQNFNTRYNTPEAITIVVNDNGAVGDVITPLKNELVIEVEVESVNDPPAVGHLEPVLGDQALDVETLSTINLYKFRMRNINQTEHYVEVDEDTPFVFNHTWLWIEDVDAQEAFLIEKSFVGKTALQAYQLRTYSCNFGWDSAGLAELAKLSDMKEPSCQQNPARTGFVCVGGMLHGCSCYSTDDFITCSSSCTCSSDPQKGCCYCQKPPVCPTALNGNPVKLTQHLL